MIYNYLNDWTIYLLKLVYYKLIELSNRTSTTYTIIH